MWLPLKNNKFGVAVYNWRGDVKFGLPLEIGDSVEILEEYAGWYRGRCKGSANISNGADGEDSPLGIFPASIIREYPGTTTIPLETEPLVTETAAVLRDWGKIWKKLYVENEVYRFQAVRKVMTELLTIRRALVAGNLPRGPAEAIRNQIAAKLDWGNRKLGLELVPREGSRAVQPGEFGAVKLYRVHLSSADSVSSGTLRRSGNHSTITTTSASATPAHLWCCVRECPIGGGQTAQALLSLYDPKKQTFVSERFLVRLDSDGFTNYLDKLHTNCAVFTDLGADLNRELYLVVQIVRVGKILATEGTKRSTATGGGLTDNYRRPLGGGVMPLADFLTVIPHQDEREFNFKIYQCEEKDFHQLHELIIKKQSNKYSPLSGNFGMTVAMRLIKGDSSIAGLVSGNASPAGAVRACKLGFPDIIMPGDVRNDLFVTIERGEFERGGKPTPKNVLATIAVYDSSGCYIEDCVWSAAGAGPSSNHDAPLLYHNNQPIWQEAIRLAVPLDRFPSAHLRIDFRHCSTRDKGERKLFGFAFARLMEECGATVSDGQHELFIYKCEDPSRLANASYLNLPSNSEDVNVVKQSNSEFTRSSKEIVTIKTLLCSTKLTQNGDLLALLQWRAHPDRVQETLLRIIRLPDRLLCEELIKFLQDVLDALFALFSTEDGNSTPHSGTVFLVLVSIFSLLDENKFQHFRPVMDAYIDSHFAAALVYKGLLSSVQHCAEWAMGTENQDPIKKCFHSLGLILRLAVQSRRLFARATGGQYEDSFRRDLRAAAAALAAMLRLSPTETIISTQISLLGSCGAVMEQVGEALGPAEGARAAAALLDAPQPLPSTPPTLAKARLHAAKQLVATKLFTGDPESRNILITVICRHVRAHLSRCDELEECADLLGEVLASLNNIAKDTGQTLPQSHLDILCLGTLDALVDALLNLVGRTSTVLGALTSCLLGLLELVEAPQLTRLCDSMEHKPLKDFLMRTFLLFTNLIDLEVFPGDWLMMRVSGCAALLKGLQLLAPPLPQRFLGPDPPFDPQVWSTYLGAMVRFLRQSALQVESWGRGWKSSLLRAHGDLRVPAALHLLSMWSHLGDHKLVLAGEMVGPLLEVTLVAELRRAALGALVELMARERAVAGHARRLEAALVDRLDTLVSDNKADDEYRRLFNTMLMERVQAEEGGWREAGAAFVGCVTRLLERLLDYRAVLQGEENRDKRMACTVNLLNFYKNEIDRKELYLRYIYRLHDLHLAAENYTEAGYTMKLYADMLNWDSSNTIADPNHPNAPEWERKEMLYHKILGYFDRGKCWEAGIPLCKELADLYETRLYDYSKLAHVLRTRARFHENILSQLRPDPEYFRVGYYGQGFPLFVRNKQFVYRGLEYERIGAFTARLQAEFPSAQILMKNSPPDDNILNSDGQYIQICNVRGVALPGAGGLGPSAPEVLTRHYQAHHLKTFHCDRPKHKGPVDKDNEFKSLWIERTTLVIENELPGILRWSEVVTKSVEEIAPIQYACETMETVEKDLRQLVALYTAEPSRNINPFSMRLQGIIDANVMGGPSKYQEAFLCNEFLARWPRLSGEVTRLRSLLAAQTRLLEAALVLHGRLAPASVQPLHRRLLERFAQLKETLAPVIKVRRQQSESIVNTPLPPVPVERRTQSLQGEINDIINNSTYEDAHLYTKPIYSSESADTLQPPVRPTRLSRDVENLSLPSIEQTDNTAPPLPPRSAGLDKRASLDGVPPNIPKRTHKHLPSEDNISLTPELRDSGISTASLSELSGALNSLSYEEYHPSCNSFNSDSRDFNKTPDMNGSYLSALNSNFKLDQFMNIIPDTGVEMDDAPPPIPPKIGACEKSENGFGNDCTKNKNQENNDGH